MLLVLDKCMEQCPLAKLIVDQLVKKFPALEHKGSFYGVLKSPPMDPILGRCQFKLPHTLFLKGSF
jgi:hypothetical protein